MSTAQEIVTDAFRLLAAIDIAEAAPSAAEMTVGLRALTQMIDAWAGNHLNVLDQTVTGTVDGSTAVITDVSDTSLIAVGMTVTGTGVSGRIKSIDDAKSQIELDAVTTVAGESVSLACTFLPLQSRHEQGVAALLALRLAPLIGQSSVPAYVQKLADDGWHALQAQFQRVPQMEFDEELIWTTNAPRIALIDGSG